MAYGRYDNPRMRPDDQYSGRGSRSYGRNENRGQFRDDDYDRDDRDFFDRASDEVRSWFGDERAERRREQDRRYGSSHDYSGPRYREEGYRRPYTGRRYDYSSSEGRGWSDSAGFERGYGREIGRGPFQGIGSQDGRSDYDRDYGVYGRNQPQSSTSQSSSGADSDYRSWRKRQIDALDRDYDEWRNENRQRFDEQFNSWRNQRMTKRELMRQIPEHAEVIGSDGKTVGVIDKLRGDRIILTKNDSPDGQHHSLSCSHLETIEKGKVKLNIDAEKAQQKWRDEQLSGKTEDQSQQSGFGQYSRSSRSYESSF